MNRLFCFGLGYVATNFARGLKSAGWQVGGTTRSPDKAAALRCEGIDAVVLHPDGDLTPYLAEATHLLSSIAPDETGDPALVRWSGAIGTAQRLAWIGYLSATSVYGNHGGAWVDENSALNPTSSRGERRIAAEFAWLALGREMGIPSHIFRIAGIYGPGRNALATVKAGRAQRIVKPGIVFSRIHVDDIAAVLAASIARACGGAIYNVADDEPAAPDQVISYACTLLGVAPPPIVPFEEAVLSPLAREFYADAKLIANRRIKEELGVRLRYPSYRAGLRALLSDFSAAVPPGR